MQAQIHSPITSATSSPPTIQCVPGRNGIPVSTLGHLVCSDYLIDATDKASHFVRTQWPLLSVLAMAIAAASIGWLIARRLSWRRCVARAIWLQIVPPVTATPVATVSLWRLLSTLLPSRRWALRPRRLVWEVHASPTGMRCGLWVPPGVNPTAVVRALRRAWPGVRVEQARAPVVAPERPTVAVALRSTQPDWLAMIDDATPLASRARESALPEDDRLAALFDGLAAAGRTGAGLLQIHVARAPRHRVAVLRRAAANPHHRPQRRTGPRLVVFALRGVRLALGGVLDLVLPGASTTRAKPAPDLIAGEQARRARARCAEAPHLLVAVRASATGPTLAAARAAAADITAGYSLLSAHWRPRRVRRAASTIRWRWVPERRMRLATVSEVAALAGLPAEPSVYGVPAAAARRLAPSRDLFTVGPDAGGSVATKPTRAGAGTPPAEPRDGHSRGIEQSDATWSAQ